MVGILVFRIETSFILHGVALLFETPHICKFCELEPTEDVFRFKL